MKEPKLRFSEFSDSLKQRNLSDITSKIGSGKTPHGGRKIYVSSGIPLIRSQNVNNDKVNFDDVVFIDEATDKSMKNSRVMTNDVLLNITGASIGRSAVYKNEANANVNQHVCIIRLIKEYSPNFLQLCLTSNRGQKQIDYSQAGGGREGLNFQAIGEMNFMFPSIEEQQKIALLFSELDNLIQSAEKELEGYRELKQGMLQKMFPKKGEKVPEIRFPEFTGDWEQRKLGDVVHITMGQSPDGSTYSDEPSDYILVQGNTDLQNGWVCPRVWTTQITKKADAGDLIMSVRAPAGAMGKTAYNAVIGRGVAAIKGNEFIYQLLIKMDKEGYWKKDSTGSTFESLNSSSIKNAEIKLPTLEEQNKIGEYFSNLDNLITSQQQELNGYKELKKGLLQQMFC